MKKVRLPKFLRNKYAIASIGFIVWICFFNDIDLFYIIQSRREVGALQAEVREMEVKNVEAKESLHDLTTNSRSLEKFARENYYMKRDNEDVYVFKERTD
ncbi:MAG: septum formation initiator family protein [Flavobacteriales bacterium]|nr:septum formation initiator family protein [Flavobacteriales bacterium]